MRFVDEATIWVRAGKGGDGSGSFRREKYVEYGGPDGGDGGRGGSVYFEATTALNTLIDFRYTRKVLADDGQAGAKRQCFGRSGEDKLVQVPVGTRVFNAETNELIVDLNKAGQQVCIAKGGRGGLGNVNFKSSTNRAPSKFTKGTPGESFQLKLELSLLADVGLVGFPNAGKSTFVSHVSAAKPKIADYPFTTLVPNLGTVKRGEGRSFVIADIPGIIEGASEGAGLGLKFLKHIQRTRILLHVLDVSLDTPETLDSRYVTLNEEMTRFSDLLASRPQWLVLNKIDVLDEEQRKAVFDYFTAKYDTLPIFAVSAATGEGMTELMEALEPMVKQISEAADAALIDANQTETGLKHDSVDGLDTESLDDPFFDE